jgi:hypothetical protein
MTRVDLHRVGVFGAACLWLFLTAMYVPFVSVFALPGWVPALALFLRGQSVHVLVGSVAAGLLAAVLGTWVLSTAIPADPVGLPAS